MNDVVYLNVGWVVLCTVSWLAARWRAERRGAALLLGASKARDEREAGRIAELLADRDAALKAQQTELQAESRATFEAGTDHLTRQLGDMQVELERAREVAQDERAKRERYFVKITDFETLSLKWQRLYYDQATGHGNAQQMMMDCIEALARQVQSLGGKPRIPAAIQVVRSEFMEGHETPALAGLAELQAAQSKASAAST